MANNDKTKVITGPQTRWSYVNAWEPKSINGSAPKYSVQLIIPKTDTVTVKKIKKGTSAAIYKKVSVAKKSGVITLSKGKYKKGTYYKFLFLYFSI